MSISRKTSRARQVQRNITQDNIMMNITQDNITQDKLVISDNIETIHFVKKGFV